MNRRQFLGLLGTGAAAVTTGQIGRALAAAPLGTFLPAQAGERDPAALLIARLTFGVTPALYAHVQQIGAQAFIDEQLAPESLDDGAVESRLAPYQTILAQNGGLLAQQYQKKRQTVTGALLGSTTLRAAYSERQLYERMVHFFSDHFSLFIGKAQVLFLKVDDDRDAIRPYALGHFREILGASAHSPAMLIFLDNARSDKRAPNENYARELMELHTLGVNGGYSEDDVKAVARAFTGWSVQGAKQSSDGRTIYRFRPGFHDRDAKMILGQAIPAGGTESDGETMLDILAGHPSAAQFISTKLVRRFVSDDPPTALVDACAQTFTSSGGAIRAVLRTIFAADEFWSAPPKFKQPYEYTVSLLRALNADVQDDTRFLRGMQKPLQAMGQIPFTWPAPNGFPDVGAYWMSNLLPRWNMAITVAGDQLPGTKIDMNGLVDLLDANNIPLEAEPVLLFLATYLFGRPLSTAERDAVLQFAADTASEPAAQIGAGLSLLLAAPAFQYK
ncbi:MAG: DUF1800 domain-containing protein [Chloroflexota bacterium]